jgi:phosphopantetheine adenylyltransferase
MKDDSKWWKKTNICAPSEDVEHVLEIENVKKECDRLMMEKISKYETIIEELKAELARAKEDHQYDNLVHKRELESLKNPIHDLRKKGLM